MTDPSSESHRAREAHGAAHGRVRSMDDRIASVPIVAIGVGALVLFFLASFVTISFIRVKEGDRPPLPVPQEVGLSKIGMVEQQLFESATRGEKDRAARRQHLGAYGWVDRKAGLVHLPIDRAMELSARGVRPRAAPPAGDSREAQP